MSQFFRNNNCNSKPFLCPQSLLLLLGSIYLCVFNPNLSLKVRPIASQNSYSPRQRYLSKSLKFLVNPFRPHPSPLNSFPALFSFSIVCIFFQSTFSFILIKNILHWSRKEEDLFPRSLSLGLFLSSAFFPLSFVLMMSVIAATIRVTVRSMAFVLY